MNSAIFCSDVGKILLLSSWTFVQPDFKTIVESGFTFKVFAVDLKNFLSDFKLKKL